MVTLMNLEAGIFFWEDYDDFNGSNLDTSKWGVQYLGWTSMFQMVKLYSAEMEPILTQIMFWQVGRIF